MRKELFNVWSVPKASVLPAILLGTLVLFTYSTLQNYGPQSTIRKFHSAIHNINQAVVNGSKIPKSDWEVLRSTLEEDIGELGTGPFLPNRDVFNTYKSVAELFQEGRAYSLGPMDRRQREVRIAVIYMKGKTPPISMVWVVEKPSGGREWKISAHKTVSAMTDP
ncbi:MAG: hypothetical protein WCG75_08425 [Armatimonadota bacterium]